MKQQLPHIKLKSATIHDIDNFLKELSDIYQQMKWMLSPRNEADMLTDLLNGIQHFGWYNDFVKCCIILAPTCIEAYKNALHNFIRLGLATTAFKSSKRCDTCGKNGHLSKNCYKNNNSKSKTKIGEYWLSLESYKEHLKLQFKNDFGMEPFLDSLTSC